MAASKQQKSTTVEPLLVYCRLKPSSSSTETRCIKITSDCVVQLTVSENFRREYTFKRIFSETSTQKEVFDEVALPLVNELVKGKNGLLFTYGVTGSGKTYTMTGNKHRAGLMQRCFDVLFNSIQDFQAKRFVFKPDKVNGFEVQGEQQAELEREEWNKKNLNKLRKRESQEDLLSARSKDSTKIQIPEESHAYAVFISYIEVYNNYVYDLLDHLSDVNIYSRPQPKLVREDSSGNMYIHGITETEVKSVEEAYDILRKGQRRKRMAHTALNADSSRSHSVFTIRLVQAPLDTTGETVSQDPDKLCISQLSLVDLAGSERTNRTKNIGQRLCEAGKINQSLMALRKCIESLRENQLSGSNRMVPYREQKITMLFKNFFEGDGNIRMILCVNPSIYDAEENALVLQFAEVSQDVTTKSTRLKVDFDPVLISFKKSAENELEKSPSTTDEMMKEYTDSESVLPLSNSIDFQMVYDLGEFPAREHYSSEEDFRRKLILYLEERILKIDAFKAEVAKRISKFRNLLVQYNEEHIVNLISKKDALGVKSENEKPKVKINRTTALRRHDVNKARKVTRKIIPKGREISIGKKIS
ncbi:kinesin-like protein KIF23 [Planococcus citri]|uniref:kinesin-like protein KIF23 n=1 Tax=Planococcus citri TaxID=170843 RepID=UPI0031F8F4A0